MNAIPVIGILGFLAGGSLAKGNQHRTMPGVTMAEIEALSSSEKGCVNRPGQNNGHCTTDGTYFFCEDSEPGSLNDCVKGEY